MRGISKQAVFEVSVSNSLNIVVPGDVMADDLPLGDLGHIFFTLTHPALKLGNLSTTAVPSDDALSEV